MLLRTRVTLIVSLSYSLLVAGLAFAWLKSEELADERFAQATLVGQEIFWKKLVENTVQRLETDARVITDSDGLARAVEGRDPANVLVEIAPLMEAIRSRGRNSRVEIIAADGELLYNSRGSLLDPPTVDAGTVHAIVESGQPVRGLNQDTKRAFVATLAVPLKVGDNVAGIALLGSDMHPPLLEFKASTGSDIFLVDRAAKLSPGSDGAPLGTDEALWKVFDGNLSVRKSRLETWQSGRQYYSVVVLPIHDGFNRVIGALVTSRDVTATQTRQRTIRNIAIAAVGSFLVFVLFVFYVYLRRSFHPLDEAIQVLNALSRGDTSVTLEVKSDKDEIGRIAGTVGVFRDNVVMIDQMQQRRERQRRRQELFIRIQMLKLSEMLEEEARAAVLHDMKQIEALAERKSEGTEGPDDAGKGELEVLGVAFQTMSDRIREQHLRLQDLIEQRTREADVLREALRTREQLSALRQELDFARELQLSSLPQVFPPFPDRDEFQIHAAMVPAKEVGGDFYDFFLIDKHHLGFVIGDASGKGVPAAMFIAITRSLIKAVAPLASTPGECMAFVNTMLAADNPQTLFATCFYAVLDTRSGEVAFCNAGHPPALILRTGGGIDAIRDVSGVALGVMEGLEYETGSFRLESGDTVLLYTDGVTEAQNVAEQLYEEYRLIELSASLAGFEPEAVIARVNQVVEEFVGDAPQFDDITMLTLRFDRATVGAQLADEAQPTMMLTGFRTRAPEPAPGALADAVPQPVSPPAAPQPAASKPAAIKVRRATPAAPAAPAAAAKPRPVVKLKAATVPRPAPAGKAARLDVTIANDLGELGRLAGLVDEFVETHGLEERIAFNLNLCLDELITNIVSYGYADDHHHDIHVRFALNGDELTTEILDDGKEYDPFSQAPEPDLDLEVDDRPIGGLGVFLVKEFMDRTDYRREDGRNVVTLVKRVDKQES
ncbi:SpoIIE family protein phosphatase [Magnetospirillum sp. UT-4]|uniref:SpoIIE family protein phosphatase n=1 Tax=Magnetospirillum sp. UT-4 TaxID=2681467 RepID=UPI00137CC174|nr:SpoIIE family protein phosphatase [Magnetospirillum sp. UT-4]CAA7612699.1 Stage II sporulation E [Magnetospirillum sp. UT-4]